MKLSRFKIGDPVLIAATVGSYYKRDADGKRTNTKYIDRNEVVDYDTGEPGWQPAIVVGIGKLVEGIRTPASGGSGFYAPDDYEPAYFTATKVSYVWKVRTTMTAKEVSVLDEDIMPTEPFTLANPYTWNLLAKQNMAVAMKDWPRDSKGKWLKNSPTRA